MRAQAAGPASSLPSRRLAGGRSPPRGCALSEHPAQSWGRGRGLRPLLGGATAARPAGPAPRPLRPSLGLSGHIWTHVSLSSCGAGGGTGSILMIHSGSALCPLTFASDSGFQSPQIRPNQAQRAARRRRGERTGLGRARSPSPGNTPPCGSWGGSVHPRVPHAANGALCAQPHRRQAGNGRGEPPTLTSQGGRLPLCVPVGGVDAHTAAGESDQTPTSGGLRQQRGAAPPGPTFC